ncbi:MAG TPA: cellulase family glycosylhydrolase [Steroidobacter sp.]|uniref:glycoside hydrolase family 5 protein n=1 Tax=Steroidobacter sp. TaxID=1978227 RepID=UPI002EDB0A10
MISQLQIDGNRFRDRHGRHIILRGVNLGGDSKVPYPNGGTHLPGDFSDHRTVSFVGRPFPLSEASEHFGRLRHWGFNCVRLLTTWEAVEHTGPGLYDAAYLDYFTQLCELAGKYGLYVIVDFHQDVWARMSGGDGAPGWTFEVVGLDFTRFARAGAAHVMQHAFDYGDPNPRQPSYPPMSWGINYRLPANAIMWTLFWAGNRLTPSFTIDGLNVQHYLQRHLLGAMTQIARRIRKLPNVLGFDTLNEPGVGWLEHRLTYRHVGPSAEDSAFARPGPALSPLDALAIANGIPTAVDWLRLNPEAFELQSEGERILNPEGIRIWRDEAECPFERAGAYIREAKQLRPLDDLFFKRRGAEDLSVTEHGFAPFFGAVARTIREFQPDWLVFAELDPYGATGRRAFPKSLPDGTVNACHWYDAVLLYARQFDGVRSFDWREKRYSDSLDELRARYVRELSDVAARGRNASRDLPVLIGEFGIPYDMNGAEAYRMWAAGRRDDGVWAPHTTALTLMYDALDELLLSSTQWNYCASNRNDERIGDGWNQEDLSIYSVDQRTHADDPDSGGRAVPGFCRPYVRCAQGALKRFAFNGATGICEVSIEVDANVAAATEIYLPRIHYPSGFKVETNEEAHMSTDSTGQVLHIAVKHSGLLQFRIVRRADQ